MFLVNNLGRFLKGALRSVGLAGLVVGVLILTLVVVLLVPLPRPLLDLLLIANFIVALLLLLLGLFISSAKQLYSFPALLLLTTLFRLALNVSSTRLILLNGHEGLGAAGQVIEAFGSLVVQRDFVVGAIIFGIIAIVNFVVIAKGSARVAEVAARFALDSLPGKQLAIDSELRAGSITRQEADVMRGELNRESQFYGSMDGAMRFVQGDALAGFVIVFINAIGGVGIGFSRGIDFLAAVNTFGVLTIGDGLVNIIPSLLISVCAGIVVTRVSGEKGSSVSDDIFEQVLAQPQVVVIVAIMLLVLSVIPGLPTLPLLAMALLLLWVLYRRDHLRKSALVRAGGSDAISWADPSIQLKVLRLPQEIYLAPDVPSLSATEQVKRIAGQRRDAEGVKALRLEVDGDLLARYFDDPRSQNLAKFQLFVSKMRSSFYRQRGILLADIQVVLNDQLSRGGYGVLVRERASSYGEIQGDFLFASVSPAVLNLLGMQAVKADKHPVTHCAACWIERHSVGIGALRRLGVEIFEPYQYLALAVLASASDNIEELFGLGEVEYLLAAVKNQEPELYREVFDKGVISLPEFSDVLRRLVSERVNIRDLKLIQEGIVEFSSLHPRDEDQSEWLRQLHGFLRQVLSRRIFSMGK